jgi:hypothetical protein
VHVCVPPLPHAWVAPGAHAPSPPHALQSDQAPLLHVRLCVPHLPQAWIIGPLQVWPPHAPHWHCAVHVCKPPVPQAIIAPGAQVPSLAQPDHADQTPLLHARVCVPQFPHDWLAGPTHVWPVHSDHWQEAPHVCVPPIPQAMVCPGEQPIAVQVPTAPPTAQLSHEPPHGRLQQTPEAQLSPGAQSLLS